MAIVGNKATEEGDILYIKTDVPAIGILALTGFTDVTQGEGPDLYFQKTFRYSEDGITWSNWINLTVENIQNVPPFGPNVTLFLEYKYKVVGDGILEFDSNTVSSTFQAVNCGYYFINSYFSNFFSCTSLDVLGWYLNVTEKLYKVGALSAFIGRTNDDGTSTDFIQFWKSVSKFFAYYVIYARQWQKFYTNPTLLKEYLSERGLATSVNTLLPDAVTLMKTYNKQMALRGTDQPFLSVRDNGVDIDGEILRMINFNIIDEFLYNLYRPELFGWNIGNCSPLYRGLQLNDSLNKFYELTPSDLSKYPLNNPSNVSIVTDSQGDQAIQLGSLSGIEDDGSFKSIVVDPNLDYEFSFLIKKNSGSDPLNLTAGVSAYNKNNVSLQLKSFKNETSSSTFCSGIDLPQEEVYYKVFGVIYNQSRTTAYSQDKLNINAGNNLVNVSSVVKLIPRITVGANASADVKNIVLRPLFTEYSRGFLQVNNFISCWLNNRSASFDLEELEGWISKYQIPYDAHIKLTQSGEHLYNEPPSPYIPPTNQFSWIGADPSV